MAALRDLGALPMDTDLEAVIKDLRLDDDVIDPTTLSGEEMVKEVQRVVKALLGYGAKLPKELMLYVKNMVFLDGAIARLAPDLDILAEVANISMVFAQKHGERLGRGTRRRSDGGGVRHRGREGGLRADAGRRPDHVPRAAAAPRADPEADARARRGRAAAPTADRASNVARRASGDRPLFGRLLRATRRPPSRSDAADHGEGRWLRGDPCRWGRVQAVELDERAEHARRTRATSGW